MDLWEMLGIPPTTDIARIKSAYARQAKLYHPEEHPEEFKALQNAYKMALRLAKSQRAAADVQETKPEQTTDEQETKPKQMENESEQTFQKTADAEHEEDAEHDFDFSGVDSYGDRELFFRQFLLLAKNPYLRNNPYTWEGFLDRKEFMELFSDVDFRISFVHILCGQRGWRRKTILYFERYLTQFHTEENQAQDGKWETDISCFRRRRLPHFRLPAFFMDRFWDKGGIALHKKLWKKLSSSLGRELNFDMKIDVIRYMKLYLLFGEANEENAGFIEHIYKNWMVHQVMWAGSLLTISLFVILALIQSMVQRQSYADQTEYIRELYELDEKTYSEAYSEKEQEKLQKNYNYYWQQAEDDIDDVLMRYQDWENYDDSR